MSGPVPEDVRGLQRAVQVMDLLRGPGGCPWDAEQTHQSLAKYLLEEAYETVDAIASGDRDHLREELGDVLLQVLFHARIAQEEPGQPFTIDDIADELADKLERRHPHVFAGAAVAGAAEVETSWEQIKAAEKQRTGPYDGVVWSQPALALAAAVMRRADRAGLDPQAQLAAADDAESVVASELLEVVRRAAVAGVDAEIALRKALRSVTTSAR